MSFFGSGVDAVPGGSGLMILTVTRNSSSVSAAWQRVLRNNAPRIGMSPSIGIFATAWRTSLLIRPAIANDSPLLMLIVVNVWFFLMTGIRKPAEVRP